MRPIKFKAKCIHSGKWLYGTPVYYLSGEVSLFTGLCPKVGYESTRIAEMRNQVHPSTLCQFTGLHDKDGKEIWEGDTVTCHYFYEALGEGLGVYEAEKEITGEISLEELGLWIHCDAEDDSGYLLWINGLHEESFTVTGNIHDKE